MFIRSLWESSIVTQELQFEGLIQSEILYGHLNLYNILHFHNFLVFMFLFKPNSVIFLATIFIFLNDLESF